ncbi:serine/threonine protein kinase [Streptomyces sp. NPDC056728]
MSQAPAAVGPYRVIAPFQAALGRLPVAESRFLARSGDGERTVLVCVPLPDSDHGRWAVEAAAAASLTVPGFLPVTEADTTAELPWYATPYVPLLTLPEALAAHGGPLPERTVLALGSSLADALAEAHAKDVVHAGLSPSAVFLSTEGPRIGSFGAVRAAGPDGEARDGIPWLTAGCVAPEQAAGGRPRPLGDVHALGAVLAFAATGHTTPERDELPASLRAAVAACLSRDPARRPQAAELVHRFTPTAVASQATVLDTTAALPLPAGIIAALARQSASVLAADPPLAPR